MSKQLVPIHAIADGVVDAVVDHRVVVTKPDGHDHWYSHLTEVAVAVGDTIAAGQVIGYIREPEDPDQ